MTVPGFSTIDCQALVTKTWALTVIDSSKNAISNVDLSANPSTATSQLVIQANTLSYGLYEIKYTVSITDSTNSVLTASTYVYVNIVPTGIIVYALQNGVLSISIGTAQSLTLQPNTYSFDADQVVSPSSLTFTYNCRTKDSSSAYGSYPTDASGTVIDLKKQTTSGFSYSYGCFSSSGKY